jgi:hypothetical protein
MLTPPPSPRPFQPVFQHQKKEKSATGRRYTALILLLPLCLVVIAFVPRVSHLIPDWNSQRSFHNPLPPSYDAYNPDIKRRQASTTSPPVFSNPLSQSPTSSMRAPQTASSPKQSGLPTVPNVPPDTPGIIPTPFPQPFDVSLASNFSTSQCQGFFLSFTQDLQFRRCRPMSMLLGTSQQFNQAQSNTSLLTDIIWGTCNTIPTEAECQSTMNNLTATLHTECSTEVSEGNLLVQQALTGFEMYTPMRNATCQVDQDTNSYCLVDAVAATSPADLYFYLLPYGNALPNDTVPSCSPCIKNVLSIYAQAVSGPTGSQHSSDASSIPLDQTYPVAAQIAVEHCGAVYAQQVNTSAASTGAGMNNMLQFIAVLFILYSLV